MRKAEIYQQGKLAGTLEEVDRSHYRFAYAAGYAREPISLALPVREAPYEFDKFPPLFEWLLPEGMLLDAAAGQGLKFSPLAASTRKRLETLLAVGTIISNPLDAGFAALTSQDVYLKCVQTLIEDPGIDHGRPAHSKGEVVSAADEPSGHREVLLDVFAREGGLAGRDVSEHRHDRRLDPGIRRQGHGPRLRRILLQEPGAFEVGELGMDRRGRGQSDGVPDLAHRGRVAAFPHRLGDEVHDPLLAGCDVRHRGYPPSRWGGR